MLEGRNHPEAVQSVEENFLAFWSRSDRGALGLTGIEHPAIVVSSEVRSVIFNLVIAKDPSLPSTTIRTIINGFRRLDLPFRRVLLPSQAESGLGHRLEAAGLVRRSTPPAMVLSLAALARSRPPPPTHQVEPVQSVESLEDFSRTLNAADFEAPEEVAREIPGLLRPKPGESQLRLFLGREEGRPVATSLRFCAGRAVGIYAVSTLVEARGRGVGAAMTFEALRDGGGSSDSRLAVLVSTRMGLPVYRRLGFETCGEFAQYTPAR